MATTNHPENQQPQGGAADLGQISTEHASTEDELHCESCGKAHTTGYSNEAEIDRVLDTPRFICTDCYATWTPEQKAKFWNPTTAGDSPKYDLDTNIFTNAGPMHEAFNPNPWVVVEFAGTDREQEVIDFPTAREAFRYVERNYTEDECDVDVMKRRDDGVLTTEF